MVVENFESVNLEPWRHSLALKANELRSVSSEVQWNLITYVSHQPDVNTYVSI